MRLWENLQLRMEPVLFPFMFAFILSITCLTDVLKAHLCVYSTNFTFDICYQNLSIITRENTEIEKKAATQNFYFNLCYIIGAIFSMCIAPWSDKYYRKVMLLPGLIGCFLTTGGILLSICQQYDFFNYIFYILHLWQVTGVIGVMTSIYSYVSQNSTDASKTLNFASIQLVFGTSTLLGALARTQIHHYLGHKDLMVIFAVIAVSQFVAILWALFVIRDTAALDDANNQWRDLCNLRECFGCITLIKHREVLLLLLAMIIYELTFEAITDFPYIFSYHMYGWNTEQYKPIYWIGFSAMEIFIFFVSVLVLKWRNVSHARMGIISTISMLAKFALMAVSCTETLRLISHFLGIFNGLGSLAVKCMISKHVIRTELAQVFVYLVSCEMLVPLLCHEVGPMMFDRLNRYIPGAAYIAAYMLFGIPLCVFIRFKKKED